MIDVGARGGLQAGALTQTLSSSSKAQTSETYARQAELNLTLPSGNKMALFGTLSPELDIGWDLGVITTAVSRI